MSSYTLKKATALDAYICDNLLPLDLNLEATLKNNASSNLDAIDVAPNQGKQLYLLAKMLKAKRILESWHSRRIQCDLVCQRGRP
jgi:predicted O-methyltransferase YrrM